jgi:hypothetical protein
MDYSKIELTHEDRLEHQAVICRLESLLKGETVDGLKIGDPGITHEWVEQSLDAYKRFLTPFLFRNNTTPHTRK